MAIEEKFALNGSQQLSGAEQPYLLYKQWQANRPNTKTLAAEYFSLDIETR